MLKKVTKLALFVLVVASLFSPAGSAFAESGTIQKGISLVNHSSEPVKLWIGHAEPQDATGYIAPDDFTFAYAGLRYTDKNLYNELYLDDTVRVNAVKVSDVEPYPSYVSQSFAIKGWVDTIIVYYTMDGGLTIQITYLRDDAPPATTPDVPAPAPTVQDSGVHFSGLNGQVEILEPGAKDWRLVDLNDVIPVGAHIRTDEDSTCVLSFADMSTFVLKPESELIITAPPGPESKLKVLGGAIWANVKKMVKDGSMDIEMNQAVCGIKGTTFVLEETGTSSTVKVIEGTVQVTSKAYGAVATLVDGKTIAATNDGFGVLGDFDTAAATAAWNAIIAGVENIAPSAPVPGTDTTSSPLSAVTDTVKDAVSGLPVVPIAVGAGIVVVLAVVVVSRAGKKKK